MVGVSGSPTKPLPNVPKGGELPKPSTQVEGSHTTEVFKPNAPRE